MKIKAIPALLVLLLLAQSGFGQKFLVLEKMGTKKRYEYYPGDQIIFKTPSEDYFTKGTIAGITDSLIYFKDRSLAISEITDVDISSVKGPSFGTYAGTYMMVGGGLLLLIDVVNQTWIQGGSYGSSTGVLITSGALMGAGAILVFAKKKRKKLDKWWRLRYVEI